MVRVGLWWVVVALSLGFAPRVVGAAPRFGEMGGHASIGYAKLFIESAPGGSISMAGGLDYPLSPYVRAGIDVGYDLLGSRTVQRGSQVASVDYSDFQAIAFLHVLPEGLGVLRRVSLGPGLLIAHGDLSVTGGGASFSDLAVGETCAAAAAQVTLMPPRPAPLQLGLELGGRVAFMPGEDWKILVVRATAHY